MHTDETNFARRMRLRQSETQITPRRRRNFKRTALALRGLMSTVARARLAPRSPRFRLSNVPEHVVERNDDRRDE